MLSCTWPTPGPEASVGNNLGAHHLVCFEFEAQPLRVDREKTTLGSELVNVVTMGLELVAVGWPAQQPDDLRPVLADKLVLPEQVFRHLDAADLIIFCGSAPSVPVEWFAAQPGDHND